MHIAKKDIPAFKQELLKEYLNTHANNDNEMKLANEYVQTCMKEVNKCFNAYIKYINNGFSRTANRKDASMAIIQSHAELDLQLIERRLSIGFMIKIIEQTPMGLGKRDWVASAIYLSKDLPSVVKLEYNADVKYTIKAFVSEFTPLIIK